MDGLNFDVNMEIYVNLYMKDLDRWKSTPNLIRVGRSSVYPIELKESALKATHASFYTSNKTIAERERCKLKAEA